MFTLLFFVISFIFIPNVHGGTCPKYPILKDFVFESYTGMWYQQDKLQSGWEAPGRCWKSHYIRDPKTGQYKMRMIFQNTLTGRNEGYDSQLTLLGPIKPSIIKYTIPFTFMEDMFQVLATDYDTFSVEYKCNPNGILEKRESVFLLTREKNPSPLVLQRAYAIMHRYGIDLRKLERVDQSCGGIQLLDDYNYDYNYEENFNNNIDYQATNAEERDENLHYQDSYQAGTSYAPHTNTQERRRHPVPRQDRKQPRDRRLSLGQSLATRLWHVLHTPLN